MRLPCFALLFCTVSLSPVFGAIRWPEVTRQPLERDAGAEARGIAENLLLYQFPSGGWPKNIDMAAPLSAAQRAELEDRAHDDATIDNGATTTQIRFLARIFVATEEPRFRAAAERGLDYLLAAQYPNGGWPQYFPLRRGYYRHITFNDDAMVNALEVLRDAAMGRAPFAWVDAPRREKARAAVARGVDCIRQCQVVQDGKPTAWGAQHDEVTFAPAWARKFEPPSLAAAESAGIVRFLMSLEHPSPEVVAAVEAAVSWFERVKLTGLRWQTIDAPAQPSGKDRVVVADEKAPPLWARFYELGSNRPIFIGRDAQIRYAVTEIEHERRNGYAWYGTEPAKVLKAHPAWRRRGSAGAHDANTRTP
ncbi:MAG: pectate lyase [Opitutus sp.]|nr:pectate lyase [Opitutus sp.]